MGTEVIPKLSFEEFRQLPVDGKRYELVRGEVHVTPAPNTRHQFILRRLVASLERYLARNPAGEFAFAPLDVRLAADIVLQPDLIFVSAARVEILGEDFVSGAPDIVLEILSPSTSAHDRATKIPLYAQAGVPEIWLIDPQAKTVEVLKLQGKKYLVDSILAGDQALTSSQLPDWELPLAELFAFLPRI
jgi:Uma2 family endonuclease